MGKCAGYWLLSAPSSPAPKFFKLLLSVLLPEPSVWPGWPVPGPSSCPSPTWNALPTFLNLHSNPWLLGRPEFLHLWPALRAASAPGVRSPLRGRGRAWVLCPVPMVPNFFLVAQISSPPPPPRNEVSISLIGSNLTTFTLSQPTRLLDKDKNTNVRLFLTVCNLESASASKFMPVFC